MTPSDVCKKCDGVGKLIAKVGVCNIFTCPVCEGTGWDPEAVKRELQAPQSALENIKL